MGYFLAHFDFKQRRPKTIYFRVKEQEPINFCFEAKIKPTIYLKASDQNSNLKLLYGLFIVTGGECPKLIWIPTDEEGIIGDFPVGAEQKVHIEDLLNSTYFVFKELSDDEL